MIKLSEATIKVSKEVAGSLVEAGITEADRKFKKVDITSDAVTEKIVDLVSAALSPIMSQIAAFADENGADGQLVETAMQMNINNFNLVAASGYAVAAKGALYENGTESGVEVPFGIFEAPKKEKETAAPKVTTGTLDL